jgi:hypothetical protein
MQVAAVQETFYNRDKDEILYRYAPEGIQSYLSLSIRQFIF